MAAAPSRWGFHPPRPHTADSTVPYCLTTKLFLLISKLCSPYHTPTVGIPVRSSQYSLAQSLSSRTLLLGELCGAKKILSTAIPLPRLNVPGVFKLALGPRWAMGVDGTDPVACTPVSVLSASTELGMGVLGFSCFCCTANSCRKSEPGQGFRLGPCFEWGGKGRVNSRRWSGKRSTRTKNRWKSLMKWNL